jgi:O-antigen/teichoic acid export membrane protein
MTSLFTNKATNLTLRGITILLKFALSVIVIKELSVADYGVFGLFQSTIVILTFIIGFDFYTFSSREILKKNAKTFSFYFINQLVFHLLGYIFILPFTYFIFKLGIIDLKYASLFIVILISEHLSQELYRILIILNKTVVATMVLFFRSGSWILALYLFWNQNILEVNINSILILWFSGAALSVLLGFKFIKIKRIKKIDFKWMFEGVKIAFPFFVGTVLYKIIEFSGRYFLNFYYSEEEVGVYTFFSGIANILFVFVQTIVIIELFPKLIKAKEINSHKFFTTLKAFKKQITRYSILGLILSILFIYPLLWFLDKTVLFESVLSYLILLVSTLLFCFSFIPHYALYTHEKDLDILKATIISFVFNVLLSFILIPEFGILGAAISQLGAFLILLIIKVNYWKKYKLEL